MIYTGIRRIIYWKNNIKSLSLAQQYDEIYLLNMISCSEKTYGRYFHNTAELWKEKDKEIEKEIQFSMDKAKEEKANLYPEYPYEIQGDKFILDN
jgi:hypothetical protein